MQEKRSLLSQFMRFTSATVASLLVFSLYCIVDGLFVARGVGEYAMSAVNLVVPFTNILFSIAVLFAVGTSTIIAIFLGEDRCDDANRLFSQNLAVLLCIGALITVLVLVFCEPFARLLGAQGVTLPYAKHYLYGLAPFSVCFIISYNMEILVKTDGHPNLAIITVITGCVTNCILDYLAIFVLNLGITGAAVATGISQLLTCIIYFSHFFGKHTTFHLVPFKMDWNIYHRLLPLGLSDGVTELCNGIMIFLFNQTILHCLGQDGLVSYTIIAYTNTLVVNVMLGISQGTQPLISYQYGRKNPQGYRTLLRYGRIAVAVIAVFCCIGLFAFSPQLVQTFLGTAHPILNAASIGALRRYLLCYPLLGFNILSVGFMVAVECPKPAITLSMGRGLVIQAGCLLLLSMIWGGNVIWYAPALSECICLVLSLIFLHRIKR